MTPERLQEIEELFHAASESAPGEREALLAAADSEVRREVEALLAQSGDGILDRPLPSLGDTTETTVTQIGVGARLGPYTVEGVLGRGGMGEVYRATDTRLGRAVALKVSHAKYSDRFEREARAIAVLNHPNICTLYDVGPNYLVMELVEGETLAARLKRGKLSVDDTRRYGAQIANALAAAHAKGIIHRDLKPGNIMLTESGVKVLDFGLAKSAEDETLTASHAVMGTPAYMAPEQNEGKPADARSDIYSLGCVLYEMLTGSRVRPQRERVSSGAMERIVSQCLETDPERRWQSAAEIEKELAPKIGAATRWKWVIPAAAATAALLVGGYFYVNRTLKLTDKDTIVLADFINTTGDPVFDGALRQGLVIQLEQSPFLSLISDQRIRQTLGLMGKAADTRLTPEIAQEICVRTSSAAYLEGSIAQLGAQYVLGLRAKDCRNGDILDDEQMQVAKKEYILGSLSQIASKFRQRIGESLSTIEKHSTPLQEATTPSLEALKEYSAGWDAAPATGVASAVPHLKHAIAIDPQFAVAHGLLGLMYSDMGETDLAAESTRRAYELRARVSDRERLFILFLYDRQVTGNLQKELQTLELWAQTYPRDPQPLSFIAGWGTRGTGQYERGLKAVQEYLRLDPDNSLNYATLAEEYMALGRFADAEKTLQQAAARKLDFPDSLIDRYHLALFRGDQAGMDREVALARGKPGLEDLMFHEQALVLARSGRMREARMMWDRSVALAQQTGDRERAAIFQAAEAVCEAQFGNSDAGKQRALRALELAKGRDVEYASAFALARSGDSAGSQRLADDLAKRFPEDTAVQFGYLPTLRALFALARNEPAKANEALQVALPYDRAAPGTAFDANFGGFYPAYVRGEAYLAARTGAEAAAEFQKVLDNPGLVFADPVGTLAHLEQGRAFKLSGDLVRAKTAYEDFLKLWEKADGDLPILKQAKAEYAKLQ